MSESEHERWPMRLTKIESRGKSVIAVRYQSPQPDKIFRIRTLALDVEDDTDACLPNRCQWRFLCPPPAEASPHWREMEERWRQISTPF